MFDEEHRPVQSSMFGNMAGMYGQASSQKRSSFCLSDDSSSLDSSFNQVRLHYLFYLYVKCLILVYFDIVFIVVKRMGEFLMDFGAI